MVFHRSRIKTSDINVVMQQNTIDRVNSTKLSATEGYTFEITNTSYPCFKKLVKIYIQNNNLDMT